LKVKCSEQQICKEIFQLDKERNNWKGTPRDYACNNSRQHRNNDIELPGKKSIDIEEENIEADGKHFYIFTKDSLYLILMGLFMVWEEYRLI
jgi:hypothetical protein